MLGVWKKFLEGWDVVGEGLLCYYRGLFDIRKIVRLGEVVIKEF